MSKVQVYLYDLSHGMMANLSQSFLGKRLDGLWHTSVVVYGKEYFFGAGIQNSHPVLNYGTTEIPQDLFEEHLQGMATLFNASTYHLLENNCNSFTNEMLSFLTGEKLPEYVANLPKEFASTPLGAMMVPMIDAMFRNANPV